MGYATVRRALSCNHAAMLYPCRSLCRGGSSCGKDGEERESFKDATVAFLAKKEWTKVGAKEREPSNSLTQSLSLISSVAESSSMIAIHFHFDILAKGKTDYLCKSQRIPIYSRT